MNTQRYELPVNIPSLADFAERYHTYGNYAAEEGKFLFDLVMAPESFVNARVVTLILGIPAAAGVAEACKAAAEQQERFAWRDFTKQYIGALVCTLMEANGFEKTGKKGSIPVAGFTKGELYRLQAASA
jgi:hypothetical protein